VFATGWFNVAAESEESMDISSPLVGTVVSVPVSPGQPVAAGSPVVVIESMKMEHPVTAPSDGTIDAIAVAVGDVVGAGDLLAHLSPGPIDPDPPQAEAEHTSHRDLEEVLDRHARLEDDRRPTAVERRRSRRRRTARTNLHDLVDPGSFVEYGALAIAAQESRHSTEDLIERTSSDGVITGFGTINAELFGDTAAATAVVIYDDTILAGTQGFRGHAKTDRLLRRALDERIPLVLYAEGGGGRPGDVDLPVIAGLEVPTFRLMAQLSGRAPTVAVVAGYCFAGNAVFAACADVIIATEDSNLGAGGPAMIEGGGLGSFAPTDIGPIDEQVAAGVVDIRVADEAEATGVAKQYLSYFQGTRTAWDCADQDELRTIVPQNRTRIYDIRRVIRTLADSGSVLELRPQWGPGMVTALARIEGRSVGIVANVGSHMGGAIDAVGATKAARFLTLCDAYDVPVVVLADTPGFMVGPESEREGLLRHAGRLMITGANMGVPVATVVIRKGYGLGAQAMAAGAFKTGAFTIAWPTGEFGMMNLEGAVRHGYRRELEAIADPTDREERYAALVANEYTKGTALNMATHFEIDAVIDPAETRHWITAMLRTAPEPRWRHSDHRNRSV
jgi:acetyl-CoA carboxylase carboxyltransferase component